MRVILTAAQVQDGLAKVAAELAAKHPLDHLVLVGIRRGGVPLAQRLKALLDSASNAGGAVLGVTDAKGVAIGSVDITLYRDDAATALPNPRIGPSQIPGSIDNKVVVLIDDVLFTRRTIRAAFDALFDYGRPRKIELFVLVDRVGGQLPIQPDYFVVRLADVTGSERVDVIEQAGQISAIVQPKTAPSIPPPLP
jgi:pyrimidine operon attenuation protein/uracil phosphoribosyltransferase